MSDETSLRVENFIAGGLAGCVAKTLVAPVDRVKILRQMHNARYEQFGLFESFRRIPQLEGSVFALYRGNLAQLVRIFPYAGLQYGSYETLKSLSRSLFGQQADFYLNQLFCGSLAGFIAVSFTYPLDVIHSRLAFQVKGNELYSGIMDCIRKIYHEERSIRSFYRGYTASLLGMIPYSGISFSSYDLTKRLMLNNQLIYLTEYNKEHEAIELSISGRLVCGALTGAITQTIVYPLDVVRSHQQLSVMLKSTSNQKMGLMETIKYIYRSYGLVNGFYRGVSLNYVKAVPMVATSFCVFEMCKKTLFGLHTGVQVV